MTKKTIANVDVKNDEELLREVEKLVELKWSLLVEGKTNKANKVSDVLFELERCIYGLPDRGKRILSVLAASPKEEYQLLAAWHLIPIEPDCAKKLLSKLSVSAKNVHIQIIADTTLEEWISGRLDYFLTMQLSPDGTRL